MKNAKGEKLFKVIYVKAELPDRILPFKKFRAEAGRLYTEEGIDQILMEVTDWLDTYYPAFEFRMVQIAENRFKFIGQEKHESGIHSTPTEPTGN